MLDRIFCFTMAFLNALDHIGSALMFPIELVLPDQKLLNAMYMTRFYRWTMHSRTMIRATIKVPAPTIQSGDGKRCHSTLLRKSQTMGAKLYLLV